MRRNLILATALLIATLGMTPAPADAQFELSVFGSYSSLSASGAGESFGAGARIGAFNFFNHLQVHVTGTWYDSWNIRGFGGELSEDVHGDIEVLPIDLGGIWYFNEDRTGLYAGGGWVYYMLRSNDAGKFDDDTGWFVNVGYQMRNMGLFFEAIYREGDAAITELQPPLPNRFLVDIASFGANVGWKF